MESKSPTISFFGARVSDTNQQQTLEILRGYLASKQFHHVMTPNTEMIMRARRDPNFRALLNQADLAPADGIGPVWAARFLYHNKNIVRAAGADLVKSVVEMAADQKLSVLLINKQTGLDNESAAKASSILQQQYSQLIVRGISLAINASLSQEISNFKPAIVLVGLGAPDQDYWIAKNHAALPDLRLAMGVGGSFDFITGAQKRAPIQWQRAGLEWLWRLIHQPKRIGRQLAIPHFMWQILLVKLKLAKNQPLR